MNVVTQMMHVLVVGMERFKNHCFCVKVVRDYFTHTAWEFENMKFLPVAGTVSSVNAGNNFLFYNHKSTTF